MKHYVIVQINENQPQDAKAVAYLKSEEEVRDFYRELDNKLRVQAEKSVKYFYDSQDEVVLRFVKHFAPDATVEDIRKYRDLFDEDGYLANVPISEECSFIKDKKYSPDCWYNPTLKLGGTNIYGDGVAVILQTGFAISDGMLLEEYVSGEVLFRGRKQHRVRIYKTFILED